MAIGPGVDSAIAAIFKNSSFSRNFFFATNSFSSKAIIAYPPPNVNKPIFSIVKKSDKYSFNLFTRASLYLIVKFSFIDKFIIT